ncbi:heat shock 70 kDa protein 4L [Folsomia candida]|uniref:Heat shock 70 kDa protein 4L n=1 Tax=Folsomia candida TaxID=158441 RepID=A0A226EVC2_FOLCA|nr:heat shock 70 kDa protein 4L [Folsomia candida]OXA61158.1 hypothetical protein Fcan01_04832 [Folsomia candida]
MSVIGIDFGNESCFVAVARAGGIETVDNDYSLRATASTVAFGEKNRILGVAAKNQLVTNIKNTIWSFKRFLGRRFDDPYVQEEIKRMPFKVVAHPQSGGVAVQVRYLGEERVFSMEQIAAMLFTKLKETTEAGLKTRISDCVFSVPSFFTDVERRALVAAAQMAGFNVLRLLNETVATSLTYGIYKQDLPEEADKPRNVVFVDCGHSSLQVWTCAFNKGKLNILASTADPFLGGRDFDKVLADHFCAEFRVKYKIDPETNHRAYVRLLTEIEKIKKQMSANATKLPLNIECLMDDKDVTSNMCRADFEAMSSNLLQRVEKTMVDCLRSSNLQPSDIYAVEIVGGSSRIPSIKALIEKTFDKAPSTTLNQDEVVARGCALQCAILSPVYKIRDFKISDVQMYPIKIVWDESLQEDGMVEVFPLYHPVPFSRLLTFYKKNGFKFTATYSGDVPYPQKEIAEYCIKHIESPDGDPVKLKVKARISLDGIFSIKAITAYLKSADEMMETETSQDAGTNGETIQEQSFVATPSEGAATKQQDTEMEAETPLSQEDTEVPVENKTSYEIVELPFQQNSYGYAPYDIQLMTETEGKMMAEDRREKERIDAKNGLEEYVYLLRDKLDTDLTQFVEERDKSKLSEELSFLENWLYEDGSDEKRQVYQDRLEKLKKTTDPIFERHRDHHERPSAIRELEGSIQQARKVVDKKFANEAGYEHLEASDVDKLKNAIQESQQWLDHARDILLSVKPNMTSPINAMEIILQRKSFESVVHPVMNKPKAEHRAPPPMENNAADTNDESLGAGEDVTAGKNTPTSEDQQPKEMDLD